MANDLLQDADLYKEEDIRRAKVQALKEAGAVGVMLNHAEHKLTIEEIEKAIKRADELNLVILAPRNIYTGRTVKHKACERIINHIKA